MNRAMVRFLLSKLLIIEAGLLLVPLVISVIYQEDWSIKLSILYTIGLLLCLGGLGSWSKPQNYHIYTKEGMLIVALCWVLWSFFGALPFVFSGQIPSIIDAFFEVSSGFTTTGATILPDVSVLSHSLLFWRSFTHLIGGMGVLVFALAIMSNSKNGHHEVMRAEVPGPVFGKVVAKLKNTAQILYFIYMGMFLVFTLILWLCGMPLFDSIITAMGGAGTGGFGVYNDSIAHYNNPLITYVVAFGVMLFGINFNLYYLILMRKFKLFFKDTELRFYLGIILVATIVIILNVSHLYTNINQTVSFSFFQVTNVITTTGFGITDLTAWPLFAQFILLLLMFLGGSAGSTAGGFKVIRALIISKIVKNEVLRTLYPRRIMSLHIGENIIDKETQHSVLKYLAIYIIMFVCLLFCLSIDHQKDFMVVVSAAASTFNNIGPMLGTAETFDIFSPFSKLLMSLAMIAGRLEIYPMLLLFLKRTWSKY
ncbi:TrkH family potassium uptake protein [Streptococcus pluranimalium]|uniref:TrkH family potassium uptake protein n=1 Tax=Streptococcus pluranimalium TaxID=82348 RepID=UPI004046FC42